MRELNVIEMVVGTFFDKLNQLVADEVPTTAALEQLQQTMDAYAVALKRQAEVVEELTYYTSKFAGDKAIPSDAHPAIQLFLRSVHERLICEDSGNEGQSN